MYGENDVHPIVKPFFRQTDQTDAGKTPFGENVQEQQWNSTRTADLTSMDKAHKKSETCNNCYDAQIAQNHSLPNTL